MSTSQLSSGASTPRSKLDTLTKEQLILFVKKQVTKLKETQAKLSEAQKELLERREKSVLENDQIELIEKLQCQLTELKDEKMTQTSALELERDRLKSEIESLCDKLEEKEMECLRQKESTQSLEDALLNASNFEQELQRHKEKNKNLLNNVETYKQKIESLETKLIMSTNDFAKQHETLTHEREQMTMEITQLKQLNNQLIAESTELKSKNEKVEIKIDENQQSSNERDISSSTMADDDLVNQLQWDLDSARSELNRSLNRITQLENFLEQANSNQEAPLYKEKILQLESELSESQEKIVDLKNDVNRLDEQLQEAKDENTICKSRNDELSKEVENQQRRLGEYEKLKEEIEYYKSQQIEMNERIQQNKEQFQELKDENMRLIDHINDINSKDELQIDNMMNENVNLKHASVLEAICQTEDEPADVYDEEAKKESELIVAKLTDNIEILNNQLADVHCKLRAAQEALDNKHDQPNSMLSLEIADYEKAVSRLETELQDQKCITQSINSEKQMLINEIEATKTERDRASDMCAKLKAAAVKLKKELKNHQELLTEEQLRTSDLRKRCEYATLEAEATKLQLSTLVNDAEQRAHKSTKDLSTFKRDYDNIKVRADRLQTDYDQLKVEFDTYKIRAQAILKEQASSSQSLWQSEKQDLLSQIEGLKQALHETTMHLSDMKSEMAEFQADHHKLVVREQDLNQEMQKLKALKDHMETQAKLSQETIAREWRQRCHELERNVVEVRREFERKIMTMKKDGEEKVEILRERLHTTQCQFDQCEHEKKSLTIEVDQLKNKLATKHNTTSPSRQALVPTARVPAQRQNLQIGASATSPTGDSPSPWHTEAKASPPSLSPEELPALDSLLQEDHRSAISSTTIYHDEDAVFTDVNKLEEQLKSTQLSAANAINMLQESECTNNRLLDQVNVLKEEIRRLQRNEQREKHVANSEYLKNIVVKFITASNGQQKAALMPVLTTMLRLSENEQQTIREANESVFEGESTTGSWSAYLPRWSGIS